MTAAAKAISGIGGLCALAPTSYAAYSVWNSNNPTGKRWLENSGYSLEPPNLNSVGIVGASSYACADRLFKEMKVSGMKPTSSDETVYGCAVMKLETTTNENKFSDFKSNIAIRKGDKGWIINVFVGGLGMIDYTYIELKYSNNEWIQESWRWAQGSISSPTKNKNLIIKVPGNDTAWFNGVVSGSIAPNPTDPKTVKRFNKAWISNSDGPREWILQGMMVAGESENKSQIFCSNEKTQISECFKDLETVSGVKKGAGDFAGAKKEAGTSEETDIPKEKIKTAYTTLSSSKGSWIELSEICGYGDDRNIDTDKQKKLEMFCAIVPPKVNTRSLPPEPTLSRPVESAYV